MTQNFKLTDPKEIGDLNKADICRALYNAVEFHLFGAGSWPADQEALSAFWQMLDDFGLTTVVSDGKLGTIQYTPLGVELNVELMSVFAGAAGLWDIPLLLDLMGHLDDEEAETIDASISRHPEHVIRQVVRRVYFKFCNPSKLLNRSEPVIQPARRGIKTRSGAPCKYARTPARRAVQEKNIKSSRRPRRSPPVGARLRRCPVPPRSQRCRRTRRGSRKSSRGSTTG